MMPDRHHPTEDMRRQSADERAHQIQTDDGTVPDSPGPEIADLEEWERKARTEVTPLPAQGADAQTCAGGAPETPRFEMSAIPRTEQRRPAGVIMLASMPDSSIGLPPLP